MAPGQDTTTGRSVTSIERAADVLFVFAESDRPTLGVTEIANELGVSKAVVHRILTSLRERDLIVLDDVHRRYSLGPAVLRLADAYRNRVDVRLLAAETLRALSTATEETATLSVRHGDQRIYIDKVTPDREVRMDVLLGRPFPLHAGASSKAFLAFLDEPDREAYLTRGALERVTDHTVVDVEALRAELATIREQGYAVSMGERQPDAGSVAAPVFDAAGPVAVISVSGPIERFRDHVDAAADAVTAATQELSERLGHRPRTVR
ncbi:MAG: IclR family transcriptional regulator [Actinomycetes bacterium]